MQQRAAADGYLMSVIIVDCTAGSHMINLVILDGSVYHLEPQTDAFWFDIELD